MRTAHVCTQAHAVHLPRMRLAHRLARRPVHAGAASSCLVPSSCGAGVSTPATASMTPRVGAGPCGFWEWLRGCGGACGVALLARGRHSCHPRMQHVTLLQLFLFKTAMSRQLSPVRIKPATTLCAEEEKAGGIQPLWKDVMACHEQVGLSLEINVQSPSYDATDTQRYRACHLMLPACFANIGFLGTIRALCHNFVRSPACLHLPYAAPLPRLFRGR